VRPQYTYELTCEVAILCVYQPGLRASLHISYLISARIAHRLSSRYNRQPVPRCGPV
jgi:hypothetical protein